MCEIEKKNVCSCIDKNELNDSENQEVKCSTICVDRGESHTYAVNQSLRR